MNILPQFEGIDAKLNIIIGDYGTGKTEFLIQKMIINCLTKTDYRAIYINISTEDIYKVLVKENIEFVCNYTEDTFSIGQSSMLRKFIDFHNVYNENFFVDSLQNLNFEEFGMLYSRIRHKKQKLFACSNFVDEKHYLNNLNNETFNIVTI